MKWIIALAVNLVTFVSVGHALPALDRETRDLCIRRTQAECGVGVRSIARYWHTYHQGWIVNMILQDGRRASCNYHVWVDWMDKSSNPPPPTQSQWTINCAQEFPW